jgi:EAL domain-containing protein (putative c-di-GMP-specific phosphodiesterase class I)
MKVPRPGSGAEGVNPAAVGRHVLLVDDEPHRREMLNELLTRAGYAVTACSEGRAALESLRQRTYDAMFSDIRMPDMDGLALLRAARANDLDLPVVLFTGGPSLETAVEAVEQGALSYLIMPISWEKVLEAINRAVKLGALARLKREALVAMGFDLLVGDRAGLQASYERALASVWMACQPIVRIADGSVYGHEALLRAAEPVFPHPGALLATGERLGRLPELGRTIRAAVASLLASHAIPGGVFINLHPLDLADELLLDPAAPLSPFASQVVLEITERASLAAVKNVSERVVALRELGYRIAIDDLGAGYAGLTSFAALTPDIVKLDMALVRGLDTDPVKQKLVGSMAHLCRDLGMLVVAEGVETVGERDAAVQAGCDLLQGYLFGRPSRMECAPPTSRRQGAHPPIEP